MGAVSLPAKRLADVETLKPAVARRSEDHVLQVKRILLVDDFEPWRQWVRGRLSNTRFQIVVEATDALDTLLQVKQWKPEMILLDIGLPGPNGIETAKRIRQMDRSCKIIFLTENRDPRVMTEALDTGATAYLLKMRASTELIPALEAAANGHH